VCRTAAFFACFSISAYAENEGAEAENAGRKIMGKREKYKKRCYFFAQKQRKVLAFRGGIVYNYNQSGVKCHMSGEK
jgi:hypothetical protein